MKALKFNLNGKTAFFKKPDVNMKYFTYGHIHKIALMGIFGSIMGYDGYNHQGDKVYPEFYEKLKDIRVAIVPQKAGFSKKFQTFNNTVGYASEEGVLIVNEQWLENPSWDIYFLIQNEQEERLSNKILNQKTKYIPYLGKNDHPANIENVELVSATLVDRPEKIDSLFTQKDYELIKEEDSWLVNNPTRTYLYQETLPVKLESVANQYIYELFAFTNSRVKPKNDSSVYKCKNRNLHFF